MPDPCMLSERARMGQNRVDAELVMIHCGILQWYMVYICLDHWHPLKFSTIMFYGKSECTFSWGMDD